MFLMRLLKVAASPMHLRALSLDLETDRLMGSEHINLQLDVA